MPLNVSLRWDLLDLTPVAGERLAVRLAIPDVRNDVFIGTDAARTRYGLVAIPNGEPCELAERISIGIAVRSVQMSVSADELCNFVEIACLDAQGHAALDVVINEIVEALDSGASIGCVRVVQNVLAKWRRFWSGARQELLSREQQLGLFGELWFLKCWLAPSIGISKSMDMWRGPMGARNDFEFEGVGIEVKTSSRESGAHVVNGVEQLLEPINGALLLFSLVVREETSGKESLPNLIDGITQMLDSDLSSLARFESLLYAYGYDEKHALDYKKFVLRVRSEELYRVVNGFPRIIPSSFLQGVPVGVSSVRYELSLDSASRWCVAKKPEAAKLLLQDFLS